MREPDWKAMYLELGQAASDYLRVLERVKKGQADGAEFWEAHSNVTNLISVSLCWQHDPELYADILEKQRTLNNPPKPPEV